MAKTQLERALEEKETNFRVRGRDVDPEKISRGVKRKQISDEELLEMAAARKYYLFRAYVEYLRLILGISNSIRHKLRYSIYHQSTFSIRRATGGTGTRPSLRSDAKPDTYAIFLESICVSKLTSFLGIPRLPGGYACSCWLVRTEQPSCNGFPSNTARNSFIA